MKDEEDEGSSLPVWRVGSLSPNLAHVKTSEAPRSSTGKFRNVHVICP